MERQEPHLEGRQDIKSKTTMAHKYCENIRNGSELHLQ